MVIVKDLMNTHVASVDKDESVFQAASAMAKNGVSCLTVTAGDDTKRPVGIVTRRDVLEKVIVQRRDIDSITVAEVMHSPVITVQSGATLVAASGIMKSRKIKQLPVVEPAHEDDTEGSVVGIITQTDIVANMNAILKFNVSQSYEES